jgi:flagellar hook-length control protein FliK
MMSASTMTFLNVVPGAAATGAAAEATVAEGADFTAALAALLAAAPVVAGRTEPALPAAAAVAQGTEEPVLDAGAVAALLAGMLPLAAPPPAAGPEGEMPAMSATDGEDTLGTTAIIQAAGSLADSVPTVEAGAAAAAAALPVVAAAPVPLQSAAGEATAAKARPLPAAQPPQLPAVAAQQKDAQPSQGGMATAPAADPATLISASPVVNSLLAAGGATPRDSTTGTRAIDSKTTTQGLRSMMQAMAWTEATGHDAATPAVPAATTAAPVLLELQAPIEARGQDDAAVLVPPSPAVPPDLPEQAATPSAAAAGLLHANPQSAVAHSAAGAEHAVRSAVGTPRWADDLGNQLVLMHARGQQEGSLTLTPEHLGPLEVRISVSQNTANVWFGAQHADTRAALSEAMPRLRELFSDAGLALGHAGVSQEAPRQDHREPAAQEFARPQGVDGAGAERDAPGTVSRISRGLLDTYA